MCMAIGLDRQWNEKENGEEKKQLHAGLVAVASAKHGGILLCVLSKTPACVIRRKLHAAFAACSTGVKKPVVGRGRISNHFIFSFSMRTHADILFIAVTAFFFRS